MNHSIDQEFTNPQRYERALLRAREKLRFERNPLFRTIDGVDLNFLVHESKKIAEGLAEHVASGAFEPSPVTLAKVSLDKERVISKFVLSDRIVTSVFSEVLREFTDPHLSDSLYSYRTGRSPELAIQNFVRFTKQTQSRSLYVLRRDVKNYTDTIPTGNESAIWSMVDELLGDEFKWKKLVRKMIAPSERGVPTGSSITPWVANLYLSGVDHQMARLAPGQVFYCRFGDDVLIVSPSVELLHTSRALFDGSIQKLGLQINESKAKQLEFNTSGYSAHPDFMGTQFVDYLGLRVHRTGAIRLSPLKVQVILDQLRFRLRRSARNLPLGDQARLQVLCNVTNRALFEDSVLGVLESAALLREVNDRDFLRDLDKKVRRLVLSIAVGMSSVKGFRSWSPRDFHEKFHLRSLEYSRNFRR